MWIRWRFDEESFHQRKNVIYSVRALFRRPNKNYIQSMNFSTQIKPISYVKANAAQVLRDLTISRDVLVITQNGEATAVMQDIAS